MRVFATTAPEARITLTRSRDSAFPTVAPLDRITYIYLSGSLLKKGATAGLSSSVLGESRLGTAGQASSGTRRSMPRVCMPRENEATARGK